jgi:hypothetical protein
MRVQLYAILHRALLGLSGFRLDAHDIFGDGVKHHCPECEQALALSRREGSAFEVNKLSGNGQRLSRGKPLLRPPDESVRD